MAEVEYHSESDEDYAPAKEEGPCTGSSPAHVITLLGNSHCQKSPIAMRIGMLRRVFALTMFIALLAFKLPSHLMHRKSKKSKLDTPSE